jgi:hypothetical protein
MVHELYRLSRQRSAEGVRSEREFEKEYEMAPDLKN